MPGRLLSLTRSHVTGWAAHPVHGDYRVLVNVVHRTVVLRSVLAEQELSREQTGGAATKGGFHLDLARLALPKEEFAHVRFMVGETDEWLEPPERRVRPRGALTVEELLAASHAPRRWVKGLTYVDALSAGLHVETVVDLLYRDYLGRPSDPNGLAHYAASVRSGANTFDDIRRAFLESDEFRNRRKTIERAPGSVFSQGLVMAIGPHEAKHDADVPPDAEGPSRVVDADELALLDGNEFVVEAYQRLFARGPTLAESAACLARLDTPGGKLLVLRELADDLEAVTRGVRVSSVAAGDLELD